MKNNSLNISQEEYRARRAQLMASMEPHGIAILSAAPHYKRNNDTEYTYRQTSDFYYLTGFNFPDAILLLVPGRAKGEFILFNQEKDPVSETWTGIRPGQVGAVEHFLADESFAVGTFSEKLPDYLKGCKRIYYAFDRDGALEKIIQKTLSTLRDKNRSGVETPSEFFNLETLVHDMRLRKSDNEIAVMQRVANISALAHIRAMKACKPGLYEHDLCAEIIYACMKEGVNHQAYPPIVAGGENACILHYVDNNKRLPDHGLVLIDAGGELDNYAADITRTFPVNGKFNVEQRAIYNAVLKTQLAVIALIAPGVRRDALEKKAIETITTELMALGLLKGDLATLIQEKTYTAFYMHRIGHWLGLDVHDVGSYYIKEQSRVLEHGMVLTVEPGLYIAPDNMNVDKKWRGIGVRIEDDVVVTAEGHEVLSSAAPKTIEAIEALMNANTL